MRVLAGGPTRETDSAMFRLHCEGLEAQASPYFLCGCGHDGRYPTHDYLGKCHAPGCECTEPGDYRGLEVTVHHELVPDPGGPRWHHEKIRAVAKARQAMFERVEWDGEGDALLMVDTDVILGPGVLERMRAVDADVVFGVFWTAGNWGNVPGIDVWPQVWDRHSYRFTEECWAALTAPGVNEVPVLGGGACTLIRGRGFESNYWPLLESLSAYDDMMCGEDRSYCLGLEARGIKMVAVTGLPILHLYTPELRTPEMLAKAREMVGLGIDTSAAN